MGFSAGSRQGFRVRVEARDFGFGVEPFGQEGQIPGAGADLEHAQARAELSLLYQPAVGLLNTEQAGEWIVEGEKPIAPRSRKIVLVGRFHVHASVLRFVGDGISRAEFAMNAISDPTWMNAASIGLSSTKAAMSTPSTYTMSVQSSHDDSL
jgi:hypothetical protein